MVDMGNEWCLVGIQVDCEDIVECFEGLRLGVCLILWDYNVSG